LTVRNDPVKKLKVFIWKSVNNSTTFPISIKRIRMKHMYLPLAAFICIAMLHTASAQLYSITPAKGDPGQTLSTTITGSSYYFSGSSIQEINGFELEGATSIFGTLTGINAIDSSQAYVDFTIPANAPLGLYSVVVNYTFGWGDYLYNAFRVGDYTVSGFVFNDLNQNGIKNVGEPGIAGQQVLILPDNVYVTTDGTGYYVYEGVDNSSYTLKWDPDPAYFLTGPDSINVTLTNYQTQKNFGIHIPIDASMSGHVYYDVNGNGVEDAGDQPLSNQQIQILPDNVLIYTDPNGDYTFGGSYNTSYTLTIMPGASWTVTSTPLAYTITLLADVTDLDFGLLGPPPTIGLETYVMHTWAACSTPKRFNVKIKNTGTADIDTGYVRFWWPNVTPLDSTYPTADVVIGDTLYWYYSNLPIGQTKTFSAWLYIPGPGIVSDAYAFSYGENGSLQGFSQGFDSDIVTCAYDPNDKNPNRDTITALDYPIDYTIRFQNTGTDSAHNIIIHDTLSSLLDWTSFEFIESSHPVSVQMNPGNGAVAFIYNDIFLPDSNVNEPASHGQLSYRIYPLMSVPAGSAIHNTASIYFDANPPVVTNDALVVYCNRDTLEPTDVQICSGDSVQINGAWFSQSGTYLYHSSTVDVCDVLNTVALSVIELPEGSVQQLGLQLTALDCTAASYQWIDCNTNQPVTDATDQTFTAPFNGLFAVQLTNDQGCSVVSACVAATGITGVNEPQLTLVPNPAKDNVQITCTAATGVNEIVIRDLRGKELLRTNTNGNSLLDLTTIASGIYYVSFNVNDQVVAIRKLAVIK
jgi:uncharacterized repeat protein (TIGR01451 family)